MKQLRHNPRKKTSQTCKNSSKPIKTRKNRSPKPTKSLVCRGHQTLFFVGLECLCNICPQNFWILYMYIDFKYIYKSWSAMTVEINTYHSLISSSYTLHQPNPWQKTGRAIKTLFWVVFCEKKQVLVNKTRFLMKQLRHNPRKKTSQTCKNSSKPIKTRKNRSPKPTKSLVCRGHQTLFFVGLECLRSICPQNFWILYRF